MVDQPSQPDKPVRPVVHGALGPPVVPEKPGPLVQYLGHHEVMKLFLSIMVFLATIHSSGTCLARRFNDVFAVSVAGYRTVGCP